MGSRLANLAAHKGAILGFLVSVAYWPGILSAAFVPRWAVIAVGVPLVCRFRIERIPAFIGIAVLGLLIWAGISVFHAPDRLDGALELFYFTCLAGAFVLGAELETIDDIMSGLAWGVLPSALICIAQYLGWHGLPGSDTPSGLFFNTEVLAEFCAPLFVWAALGRRWALILIIAIPLFLGHERLALFVVVACALAVWWPKKPWLRFAVAGLVISTAALGLLLSGQFKLWTAGLRVVIWGATAMAITPLGNGLGWFQAAHPLEQYAHSDVLQAFAELGLAAVLLLAVPFAAFFRQARSPARIVFFGICIEACFSFPLHIPATGFMAAVLAGYLVSHRSVVRVGGYIGRDQDGDCFQWPAIWPSALD